MNTSGVWNILNLCQLRLTRISAYVLLLRHTWRVPRLRNKPLRSKDRILDLPRWVSSGSTCALVLKRPKVLLEGGCFELCAQMEHDVVVGIGPIAKPSLSNRLIFSYSWYFFFFLLILSTSGIIYLAYKIDYLSVYLALGIWRDLFKNVPAILFKYRRPRWRQ